MSLKKLRFYILIIMHIIGVIFIYSFQQGKITTRIMQFMIAVATYSIYFMRQIVNLHGVFSAISPFYFQKPPIFFIVSAYVLKI